MSLQRRLNIKCKRLRRKLGEYSIMETIGRKYFKKEEMAYSIKYFWESKLNKSRKISLEFIHMESTGDAGENSANEERSQIKVVKCPACEKWSQQVWQLFTFFVITPHQSLLFISNSQSASQYSLYIKIITIKSNSTWGTVVGFSLFFRNDVHLWWHRSLNHFYGNEDGCGHWFVHTLSLNLFVRRSNVG